MRFCSSNPDIGAVIDDSRKVNKNSLFVAIQGLRSDAHDYVDEVISKGAIVIIGEKDPQPNWLREVTYIKVKDSRKALSLIAANWFDNPADKMSLIGVTGTDGKTTVSNMIHHLLIRSGVKVGLISTTSAKINKKVIKTGLHTTTPEPLELQMLLYAMV